MKEAQRQEVPPNEEKKYRQQSTVNEDQGAGEGIISFRLDNKAKDRNAQRGGGDVKDGERVDKKES